MIRVDYICWFSSFECSRLNLSVLMDWSKNKVASLFLKDWMIKNKDYEGPIWMDNSPLDELLSRDDIINDHKLFGLTVGTTIWELNVEEML